MKGVRKAQIKISKENRLYNPRYSYMTENSRKNDSVSLSKKEKTNG